MKKSLSISLLAIAFVSNLFLPSCGSGGGSGDAAQEAFEKLRTEKKAMLDAICTDLGKLKTTLDAMPKPGSEIIPLNMAEPLPIGLSDDKCNVLCMYYPDLGNSIETQNPHFNMKEYGINMAGNQNFNKVKMLYIPETMISADFKAESETLNNFDMGKTPYIIVLKNPVYNPVEVNGETYSGGGMTLEVYLVNSKTMTVMVGNTLVVNSGMFAGYDKKAGANAMVEGVNKTSREAMTLEISHWLEKVAAI